LPPTEQYDGFPQLENGIGLSRNFLDEWAKTTLDSTYRFKGKSILLPVGEAAFKLIDPLVAAFNAEYGTCHKVVPVINHFFGNTINVTGLLTGRDILHALSAFNGYERVILPEIGRAHV
jgi:NifB/MoaA-like Fe-S oxidoreductase